MGTTLPSNDSNTRAQMQKKVPPSTIAATTRLHPQFGLKLPLRCACRCARVSKLPTEIRIAIRDCGIKINFYFTLGLAYCTFLERYFLNKQLRLELQDT